MTSDVLFLESFLSPACWRLGSYFGRLQIYLSYFRSKFYIFQSKFNEPEQVQFCFWFKNNLEADLTSKEEVLVLWRTLNDSQIRGWLCAKWGKRYKGILALTLSRLRKNVFPLVERTGSTGRGICILSSCVNVT